MGTISLSVFDSLKNIPNHTVEEILHTANYYLPPEMGGHGSDEVGFTEPPAWFVRPAGAAAGVEDGSLDSWFEHAGTRLLFFYEGEALQAFSVLCLPPGFMLQESGCVAMTAREYNARFKQRLDPLKVAWLFYGHRVVGHAAAQGLGDLAIFHQIVSVFHDYLLREGMEAIVADYLICSEELRHTCQAGRRLQHLLGFVDVPGCTYSNEIERAKSGKKVPLMRFQLTLWRL
jgi:hypothetical protein